MPTRIDDHDPRLPPGALFVIVAQATNNPTMPNRIIAVIGPGECDAATADLARDMGARIARAGHTLITGGLGGVMLAASEGASAAGGLVVGLLPGEDTADANEHVAVPIATGAGQGRNVMLVNTGDAIIAIGKGYGTLSEIALALRRRKPIIAIGSWELDEPGITRARDADHAADLLARALL